MDPGTKVGDFTIVRFIEAGGMAEVYEARDERTGDRRALKWLSVNDPEQRKRILREGQVLLKLRHPNLVQVYELVPVGGVPVLVMEYVEGPELADWMYEARPALDVTEKLFKRILSGMALAHRAGVVHRDLHPWNILVASGPKGNPVPKVIDFGFAKILARSMTRTGVMMGTPAYMAPEQIEDSSKVDKRADVFALGCLLYYLVTGREAFDQDSEHAILNAAFTGDYKNPQHWRPDLPGRFVRTIDGCLKPDRDKRIPNIETLMRSLSGGRV